MLALSFLKLIKEERDENVFKILNMHLCFFSLLVSCRGKPAATPVTDGLTANAQWAKDNGLGPYQPDADDWAAIEAAAKLEGKVTIYANSGGIEDLKEVWEDGK